MAGSWANKIGENLLPIIWDVGASAIKWAAKWTLWGLSVAGEVGAGLKDLWHWIANSIAKRAWYDLWESNWLNEEGLLDRSEKALAKYFDENDWVNSELDKSELWKNVLKWVEIWSEILTPWLWKISALKGANVLLKWRKAKKAAEALKATEEAKALQNANGAADWLKEVAEAIKKDPTLAARLWDKWKKILDWYALSWYDKAGKIWKTARLAAPWAAMMIADADWFLPDMSFPQKQTTDEKPELSTEDRLKNVEKMLEEIRKNSWSSGSSSESSPDSSEWSGRRSAYAWRSTYGGWNVAWFHQSWDEA